MTGLIRNILVTEQEGNKQVCVVRSLTALHAELCPQCGSGWGSTHRAELLFCPFVIYCLTIHTTTLAGLASLISIC